MTGAQEIKLMIAVDSELIGGFSIQVGSKVIDTSLKGQLNQMASYLEGGSLAKFICILLLLSKLKKYLEVLK